ncbi:MAG: hypothetical protein OHK0023_27750 [Anaerolineae bacterium]
MITGESLVTAFTRNADYIHTHLNGITHAESLIQPPAKGNCILWIVGHIVCYRNYILKALGLPPAMAEDAMKRFARDSAPVLGEEDGLPRLEQLMDAYDKSQAMIIEALRGMTHEQGSTPYGETGTPRAEAVMSYMRHESYHAGQLELLREIVLSKR